jgi:hypothetical protein
VQLVNLPANATANAAGNVAVDGEFPST